jgi:glycosyltransferase involved in cell wall biosynthesis
MSIVPPRLAGFSWASEQERLLERLRRRNERELLIQMRAGRDVCWVPDAGEEPLVTLRIATYKRADMLMERALPSALAQSYERLEILVVGDATDEETERAMSGVRDPRVRFVNLPYRGIYPAAAEHRWLVAGSHPMNAGLVLARGSWIAPFDDDDEMTPDHVEALLTTAMTGRHEMVYSQAEFETADGSWVVVGEEPLRAGGISHGTVLYSMGLRFLRYSSSCWRLPEPFDWNLWRRMREIGVRIGFLEQVTFRHHESAHH